MSHPGGNGNRRGKIYPNDYKSISIIPPCLFLRKWYPIAESDPLSWYKNFAL